MIIQSRIFSLAILVVLSGLLVGPALAANYTVANGQTVTTSQLIGPGNNETGIIEAGGIIDLTGIFDYGTLSTSFGGTLINNGTIITDQTGSAAMASFRIRNSLTNNGTITTAGGSNSHGLWSSQNEAQLVNNGTITTVGTGADGVRADGLNSTLLNTGTITAGGRGMVALGGNTHMRNTGTIDAEDFAFFTADAAVTIINDGTIIGSTSRIATRPNSSFTNNGTITINQDFTPGAMVSGSYHQVTNNGTITVTGEESHGFNVNDDYNIVTNNGAITTDGSDASAMRLSGSLSTLINNGTLTVQDVLSSAMRIGSIGTNTAINNGTITVATSSGQGMLGLMEQNLITNNGTITVNGDSYGIESRASHSTTINQGTITTNGTDAHAMFNPSAIGNVFDNRGLLTATGTGSAGIYAEANENSLLNSGRIIMSGNAHEAMEVLGDDNVLRNDGVISTPHSAVITVTGDDNRVVLGRDSETLGNIVFSGTGNLLQYDVAGANAEGGGLIRMTGTVSGSVTSSIINQNQLGQGAKAVMAGNNVVIVTPDSLTGSEQVTADASLQATDLVNQRQQLALLGKSSGPRAGTQYAAAGMSDVAPLAGWGIADRRLVWAQGFGSYRERPAHEGNAYGEATSYGGMTGIDMPRNAGGLRYGIYAGGFGGDVTLGKTGFRDLTSYGGFAGGYMGQNFGDYYVTSQLMAGLAANDSQRRVLNDTASASYNSYFFSPSVTVMRPIDWQGITWVPQASLRYIGNYAESYEETGSLANQSVESRYSSTLNARLQVESHLPDYKLGSGIFVPVLRTGLAFETMLGNEDVQIGVLGSTLAVTPSGRDVLDGILGVNLAYNFADGPAFYFDGEAALGLNEGELQDNFGISGTAGLRWQF